MANGVATAAPAEPAAARQGDAIASAPGAAASGAAAAAAAAPSGDVGAPAQGAGGAARMDVATEAAGQGAAGEAAAPAGASGPAQQQAAEEGPESYEVGCVLEFAFQGEETAEDIVYSDIKAGLGGRSAGVVYVEYQKVWSRPPT